MTIHDSLIDALPESVSPITWVDIARRLSIIEPATADWLDRPAGLSGARIDWRGALFIVRNLERDREAVMTWLERLLPHRIDAGEPPAIMLDGPAHSARLVIEFEVDDGPDRWPRVNLGAVESTLDFAERPEPPATNRPVPVLVCHSIKGGTGRTMTAVATAMAWTARARRPILLVDADLEAPGISYMYRNHRREIEVSLEDVVAVAHADSPETRGDTVAWAAGKLAGQQIGDLKILPLRRDLDELASSSIRAEHLASPQHPHAFVDLLSSIADRCGCAGVVVDARAGLVPLAAQLILDPDVFRIFVTTLSGQSLEATAALVRFVARELRRQKTRLSPPLLVVNRVPTVMREVGQDETYLAPVLDKITESILLGHREEVGADQPVLEDEIEIKPIYLARIPEIADLQITSARWDGYADQIDAAGFLRRIKESVEPWMHNEMFRASDASTLTSPDMDLRDRSLSERRARLHEFAGKHVAAETADQPIARPLFTGAMRAMATASPARVPIIVMEGAKGAGKTLTARFVVKQSNWRSVVESIQGAAAGVDALVLPVLGSVQASEMFLSEIDRQRGTVAGSFRLPPPPGVGRTRELLRDFVQRGVPDSDWTRIWLDVIAWSAGYDVGAEGAGGRFLDVLRASDRRLVALVEGVEELYEVAASPALLPMLRSLLIDLPIRLRGEPGRPMGLIALVRRDTVEAGVVQNREQFRASYADFALTWTEGDVLELAAWLATKAGALDVWTPDFRTWPDAKKEEALEPLWGRKLGRTERPGERIKEAYTASWVIAVLSDLQGRFVARDLVRFLHYAAGSTAPADVGLYGSRLLVPAALKAAVRPTSEKKVSETEEEILELRPVFAKFKAQPESVVAPIEESGLATLGLNDGDIAVLRRHGIIFGDAAPFEVPELFRMGLRLRHAGARHSVLNLRRRARQRLGTGL
ncbi:KGGVGR-motif variant AAA ATPase [Azospirillum halopraeferens]|uniref:KGGVGR-motif variant AAA ATPase n=1 Tax=Azospirillum halopraeferens TaxID=34010 RepID=UPI000422B0EB|nr:hypothetical protein [Azospirillum halopraeferens]